MNEEKNKITIFEGVMCLASSGIAMKQMSARNDKLKQ